MKTVKLKPYIPQDKFTIFDNIILDHIMPTLSPNAWKCLCLVIRKTRGWHKEHDNISYSQFMTGTGIKNRTTVNKAIKELIVTQNITVISPGDYNNSAIYHLNFNKEISAPVKQRSIPTSTENGPRLVQKMDSQKKHERNNNSKTNVLEPSNGDERLLFARVNANRQAKGHNKQKRFQTLETKEKFNKAAQRLGNQLTEAITTALEQECYTTKAITNYISKFKANGDSRKNGKQFRISKNGNAQSQSPPILETDEWTEEERVEMGLPPITG